MRYSFKTLAAFSILTALLYNGGVVAQKTVEPYIGYSVDLHNVQHFSQVNTGVYLGFINQPSYKMLVSFQGSFPVFPYATTDRAFAIDPDLPLESSARSKSGAYAQSIALQHRFRIGPRNNTKAFYAVLNLGLARHSVRVRYHGYDKDNYTVLNPQARQKEIGIFSGVGVHYEQKFHDGKWFVQAMANTPLLVKAKRYLDYKALAPLAFNAGYIFDIDKKKANGEKPGK